MLDTFTVYSEDNTGGDLYSRPIRSRRDAEPTGLPLTGQCPAADQVSAVSELVCSNLLGLMC